MHAESVLGPIQAEVAERFRRVMTGGKEPTDVTQWVTDEGDDGLFGPDSVAWQVHGELATLIGGLRALLLQTLHPLAMAGVADHSAFRSDPFGRLQRTAGFIAATVFGTTEDAERAIATVRRVHRHVRGTAPDGRRYSAADPHLVTFVHVTEVDSFLAAHQVYGRSRLDRGQRDRYVAEMAEVARRLGGREVPGSEAELRAWLDGVRPELRLTAQARDAVRFLLVPPLPLTVRPAYAIVSSASIGLLPLWAQRMLWLPSIPPVDRLAVRPAMRSILGVLDWAVRGSPHRESARLRAAGERTAAATSPEV
jgi:uncharacterized protein (DUF2236 family)